MDKLPNLIKWCAEFGAKHNIKLHANTAPHDAILDSLLARVESLENDLKEFTEEKETIEHVSDIEPKPTKKGKK